MMPRRPFRIVLAATVLSNAVACSILTSYDGFTRNNGLTAAADADADAGTTPGDGSDGPIDVGTPEVADVNDAGPGCNGAVACVRTIFLTSKKYAGNFDGILGADRACTNLAATSSHEAVRGKAFVAWLSAVGADALSRHVAGTLPYQLPNGTLVAQKFDDLVDGKILSPISRDENNMAVVSTFVWTGTNSGGTTASGTCVNWTSGNGPATGWVGAQETGDGWTSKGNAVCSAEHGIYCIEK